MKASFSLKYDGKEFNSENGKNVFGGISYELEKGITVTAKINKHEKYEAIEWVLCFENSSDKNSKIISDICDCDILLPLDIPKSPEPGYMPKEEVNK